ncbi:hypothetical protein [Enterococcus diestrammenae]|uniref:hypothetical protein n=1 Tax=Enterococcus diestrammenae TaxID=1155073 RepID=UPI0022E91032|nr:hypothetical protein [Enterococcus diestrammenae]
MAEEMQRFKELYISLVIGQGLPMNAEMLSLFDELLAGEFDDNPELMSAFIQSIIDEQTPSAPSVEETITALEQENKELKQRQELAEEALLALSDMLLSR